MEEQNVSVKSVSIKYGLILGLVSIVFSMAIYTLGPEHQSLLQWVSIIPLILLIFLAHREFKNEGDGFMGYGQGLGIGVLVSLVSSVLSSIFSFIYLSFIDSSFLTLSKEKAIEEAYESGTPEEAMDMAIKMMDFMFSPGMMLVLGILIGVFFGFIVSLIVSAITKNSRPEEVM